MEQPPKDAFQWFCPHHACAVCSRKAAAAGGLLFRCAACPNAYCEDHLPAAAAIIGGNGRCALGSLPDPER